MLRQYIVLLVWLSSTAVVSAQDNVQDSLLNLVEQATEPNDRAEYLLQIAKQSYEKSHDEYLSYSHKALSETENPNFNNDSLKMKIINNVGCAYSEINDAQQANSYFFEAATIAQQLNDQRYLSNLYNNIGLTYGNVQQYDKSIEYHLKSLKIKKERNDSLGVSISYTNVGAIYYSLKDYTKAKDYFEKSFVISEEIDDIEGVAFGYTNLADIYYAEGKYTLALEYYQNYLDLVTELEYNHSILYAHKKLGEVNLKLDQITKATPHIQKAYDMANKYNYTWELTNVCLLYAELKNREGSYNDAIEYAEQALKHFSSSASKKKLASIHTTFSKIYKNIDNIDLAYYHLKESQIQQDSAIQKENLETFAEMEAKYELELKEKENSFLKQEQILSQKIISQRTIVALISTLGLLFLLGVAYWLYNQKEIKQRTNDLLEEKVEERTKHLQNLNKQLEQANEEIEQFFYITAHDLKEPLRNIICFSDLAKRSLQKSNFDKASEYLTYSERSMLQLKSLFQGIKEFFSVSQHGKKNWGYIDSLIEAAKNSDENISDDKKAHYSFHTKVDHRTFLFPVQLGIVFKNLFENGIRFNKNLMPIIDITLEERTDDFYFTIKDNGIGIAQEYFLQIFEMFEHLDAQGKHLGPGLGLSICRKIIRELKGDIRVKESQIDGTTIEFWINKEYCKINDKKTITDLIPN